MTISHDKMRELRREVIALGKELGKELGMSNVYVRPAVVIAVKPTGEEITTRTWTAMLEKLRNLQNSPSR